MNNSYTTKLNNHYNTTNHVANHLTSFPLHNSDCPCCGRSMRVGCLGSITVSNSAPLFRPYAKRVKPKNPPVEKSKKELLDDQRARRDDLFSLKYHAIEICKKAMQEKLISKRSAYCMNAKGVDAPVEIEIKKFVEGQKASFRNVINCKNLWLCPVCSNAVNAKRGKKISHLVKEWQAVEGRHVYLMTLTHRHTKADKLADNLKGLSKARGRFFGDRANRNIFEQMGVLGNIINLEFTHGVDNGWHAHNHAVIFVDNSKAAEAGLSHGIEVIKNQEIAVIYEGGYPSYVNFEREKQLIQAGKDCDIVHITTQKYLKQRWMKACKDSGLGEPSEHNGLDIQDGEKVESYLTKMELGQEMTNQFSKNANPLASRKAAKKSRNQWALLGDSMRGDKQATALFLEYAVATKNYKQLEISPAVAKFFGFRSIDSCEIPADNEEAESTAIRVPVPDGAWSVITFDKLHSQVLGLAETGSIQDLEKMLQELQNTYDRRKRDFLAKKAHRQIHDIPPLSNSESWSIADKWDDMFDDEIKHNRHLEYQCPTDPSLVDINNCYEVYNHKTGKLHYVPITKPAIAPCEEKYNEKGFLILADSEIPF